MSLALLADENVPGPIVHALRSAGHDVSWVGEDAAGMADVDVLARASRERRILITMDKDFGLLAKAGGRSSASGVILLRPRGSADGLARRLVDALGEPIAWTGRLAVVEPGRIRLKGLD